MKDKEECPLKTKSDQDRRPLSCHFLEWTYMKHKRWATPQKSFGPRISHPLLSPQWQNRLGLCHQSTSKVQDKRTEEKCGHKNICHAKNYIPRLKRPKNYNWVEDWDHNGRTAILNIRPEGVAKANIRQSDKKLDCPIKVWKWMLSFHFLLPHGAIVEGQNNNFQFFSEIKKLFPEICLSHFNFIMYFTIPHQL